MRILKFKKKKIPMKSTFIYSTNVQEISHFVRLIERENNNINYDNENNNNKFIKIIKIDNKFKKILVHKQNAKQNNIDRIVVVQHQQL